MSNASAREIVMAARRQNDELRVELRRLQDAGTTHTKRIAEVEDQLAKAWENLVEVLLPALDARRLDLLSQQMSLASIATARIVQRRQAELTTNQQQIAAIDKNADFLRRESVLNELSIKLVELTENVEPLRQDLVDIDREPVFGELLRSFYGTPTYAGKFWELSYYRHWKHGDLILSKYGARFGLQGKGADEFGALREKYKDRQKAVAVLESEIEVHQRRKSAIESMEQKRAAAVHAIENVDARLLLEVRARVRSHLDPLDDTALFQMLSFDQGAQRAAARVAGARAKRRYLDEMHQEMIAGPLADLKKAQQKNERDIQKLSRPKNQWRTMSRGDFDRRFRPRQDAWNKRHTRYDDASRQIVVFHDYDRWSPVRDFLWWDVMTDGRLDGNFIDEVHHHHGMQRATDAWVEDRTSSTADRFVDAS